VDVISRRAWDPAGPADPVKSASLAVTQAVQVLNSQRYPKVSARQKLAQARFGQGSSKAAEAVAGQKRNAGGLTGWPTG
jgi:hypothetical protein